MKGHALALLGALLLAASCAPKAPAPAPRSELEGVWIGTVLEQEGGKATLNIVGDRFHFQGPWRSEWFEGPFTIDPLSRPHRLDLFIEKAEGEEKGKTVLAVYELEGDVLTLAVGKPGSGERPLLVGHDRRVVVLRMKRAPAR